MLTSPCANKEFRSPKPKFGNATNTTQDNPHPPGTSVRTSNIRTAKRYERRHTVLYPQSNDSRIVFPLDGIWDFRTAGEDSYPAEWADTPLPEPLPMAVPGSYNDQNDEMNLRAHHGWVVYQRRFAVPSRLTSGQRVMLRIDAATHAADVYLNGQSLGSHFGGFLPFEFDVTSALRSGENLLTVAVDNRIGSSTLPVGNDAGTAFMGSDNANVPAVAEAKKHARRQNLPNFDFFNFAGLNRHVELYTTPTEAYIADIAITTERLDGISSDAHTAASATIAYDVTVGGSFFGTAAAHDDLIRMAEPVDDCADSAGSVKAGKSIKTDNAAESIEPGLRHESNRGCQVCISILDSDGTIAATIVADAERNCDGTAKASGEIAIPDAKLWNPGAAYLYTAIVELLPGSGTESQSSVIDVYRQAFGVRTIEVSGTKFLINGKPFYFKGFGKHEDSYFHGRGTDDVLNVKDVSLIHWLHANSFRTSHYPYAESMYDLCDREGIVIIDEVPAVGMSWPQYANPLVGQRHRDAIRGMVARDKNHPCVVMWSIANEPGLDGDGERPRLAYEYFHPLYELAHECDPQNRPVTLVCCQNDYTTDITERTMDVVCINRYYGWYNLSGDLDAACYALNIELDFWENIGKPVMFTEYGADTVEGIHGTHGEMFSEEFQRDYYARINAEIDKRPWFIGEQLWNFADFATFQGIIRVEGNRKGILTRDRQPKMAAHWLRERWAGIPEYGYKG